MIDFDSLVLGPALATFGRPVTFYPIVSDPGAEPFAGRGIFSRRSQDYVGEDGAVLGTDELTLGIRTQDFAPDRPVPTNGDKVEIPEQGTLPRIGMCEIVDDGDDGQGGFQLVLKALEQQP